MQIGHRSLLLGVFALMLLSGCWGVSSSGSSNGTTSVMGGGTGNTGSGGTIGTGSGGNGITGTDNSVVATPSVAGSVSVVTGASQTISVTFNSSDGRAIAGFAISDTTLPVGWSGLGFFGCASVSTGNGCVLNLTFSPTVVGSGTVTLNCVFVDNAGEARTPAVCLTIPYVATPHNNVLGTTSPSGQINAAVGGGSQSVSVNFTTDDGNPATNFMLTSSTTTLPSGWSSAAPGLSCAIVTTGNGCQLVLAYAPTSAGSGTITLGYSYTDDSGASRSGALNIPYSTASSNTVVATVSPSGQVTAVENTAGQTVAVTFTTDDGKPASGLKMTSNLAALPAGWSSMSKTFACGGVSTGNGCQLHLTYAPKALTGGTLSLDYSYIDGAGAARNGVLNVAYTATTNDSVVGMAAPSGQINAIVGSGSQAVAVTFTTNDGRPATALVLTTNLAALPAGWSSTETGFACSGISTGTACQLPLTYAPTAAGNGTLVLSYSYQNNANEMMIGSVNIDYRATTHNNIVGTPSPSALAVNLGSTTPVTFTFTTDDGNPATSLLLTSDLTSLPAGWSTASTGLSCPTVSTGAGCQLTLTYAPQAPDSGMLSLNYSYADDSGAPKTGSVSIGYLATVPHLYIPVVTPQVPPALPTGSLQFCVINGDGSLSSCAATGAGFTEPTGIAFFASDYAYVADYGAGKVFLCIVGSDGSLSGCSAQGSNFQTPVQLAVTGNTLFTANSDGSVTTCAISSDASLSSCALASGNPVSSIAVSANYAYVGVCISSCTGAPLVPVTGIDVCAIGTTGILSGTCVVTGSGFSDPTGITLTNAFAYIADYGNGSVNVCAINPDGSLSACTPSYVGSGPSGVAINGGKAYVADDSGNIYLCTVGSAGALINCAVPSGGSGFDYGLQIAVH
jgi:hypothetical protein